MNEMILTVLACAVLIIGSVIANALYKLANANKDQKILSMILTIVAKVVKMVSQTYVDALKEAGNFGEEAQKTALKMALDACLELLSQEALDYIEANFGDKETYLNTMIEAEVRDQKLMEGIEIAA